MITSSSQECCGHGWRQGLLSAQDARLYVRNIWPGDIASMRETRRFAETTHGSMGVGLGGLAVVLNPRPRARFPASLGGFSAWVALALPSSGLIRCLTVCRVLHASSAPSSSYPARPPLKALIHGSDDMERYLWTPQKSAPMPRPWRN